MARTLTITTRRPLARRAAENAAKRGYSVRSILPEDQR